MHAGGDEAGALRRRVKGLLNRLTEAALQASVGQAQELLKAHSRGALVRALTEELLQASCHFRQGPRALHSESMRSELACCSPCCATLA